MKRKGTCDLCGIDNDVAERTFKRLANDFTIYELRLTICKRCLYSMLDDFEERKDYGKVKYIPF